MRLFLGLLFLLLPVSHCFAQNTFSINTTTSLNFNFTTAASLETDQVKSNAIVININPKSQTTNVYVKISYYATPSGYTDEGMILQMDYTSVNSTQNVSNLVTGPVTLALTDQRLFSIAKRNANYSFYYNFICTAPGYETMRGNYNYTLMFTMTQN